MRFPTIFRRRVGEPPNPVPQEWLQPNPDLIKPGEDWRRYLIPELGSDEPPITRESFPSPSRRDNLHESTMVNKNGFPSQRIAVGYLGPENAPSLAADAFIFDETSGSWFKIPSPSGGTLSPGELTYFDPPCLLDHSRAKKHELDESNQAGSLEVLLIVRAMTPEGFSLRGDLRKPDTFPQGVYTFVLGTDVSSPA